MKWTLPPWFCLTIAALPTAGQELAWDSDDSRVARHADGAITVTVYLAPNSTLTLAAPELRRADSFGGLGGADDDAWWSDAELGLWGGIAGVAVGLFGALLGVLCSRGMARSFVLASCWALAGFGIAAIAVGLVATNQQQGYNVTYTLLLGGTGLFVIFAWLRRVAARAYEQRELQRMSARDR